MHILPRYGALRCVYVKPMRYVIYFATLLELESGSDNASTAVDRFRLEDDPEAALSRRNLAAGGGSRPRIIHQPVA